MRPEPIDRPRDGFALVAALAVLVVVAGLGAAMLRMTGVQQAATGAAVLGARAHFAAQSGIEWGFHAVASGGACPAAATTLTLSQGALTGFVVEVGCTASTHAEGTRIRTQFELRARARRGTVGERDHVFREVSATVVL